MPIKCPVARAAYHSAYSAQHYADNQGAYKARAKAHSAKMNHVRKTAILEHLLGNPCVDCGETDPIVLEFDHRDGQQKLFNIGEHHIAQISLNKLVAEIAKCDVRCANCHRRKTYRERGLTHRG